MWKGGKMKIKIKRVSLVKELELINGVIEKRNTMPVLNYFLLKTKGKEKIELSGTDLEIGVVIEMDAKVEEEGSFAILFSVFINLVKEMDNEFVIIESIDNENIEVKGGKGIYKLFTISADNYPTIPLPEEGEKIRIDIKELKEIIKLIKFSISAEQYSNASGGYFLFNGDKIIAASTDYLRLSYVERKVSDDYPKTEFLFYKKILSEILELSDEGEIEILKGINNYFFFFENKILISRIMENNFPDFKEFVEKQGTGKVLIKREDLIKALRRILSIVSTTSNYVYFNISNGKLVLNYNSTDSGEGEEEIDVEYEGEEGSFGFNAKNLKEFLEVVKEENLIMEFSSDKTMVKFYPEKGINEMGENFIYKYLQAPSYN
jgi:DNA polymerase-3 subunit beta